MCTRRRVELLILPGRYAVCRLAPDDPVPDWAVGGAFLAVTRTRDELSVVCLESSAPSTVRAERGWSCMKAAGPLEFTETGLLAALSAPLAEAGIPVLAVSTYETDYLLVREEALEEAARVLTRAGHEVAPR